MCVLQSWCIWYGAAEISSSAAFVCFEGGSSLLTQKGLSFFQTCFSKSVHYIEDVVLSALLQWSIVAQVQYLRVFFLKVCG
jgi:hypothetical protein